MNKYNTAVLLLWMVLLTISVVMVVVYSVTQKATGLRLQELDSHWSIIAVDACVHTCLQPTDIILSIGGVEPGAYMTELFGGYGARDAIDLLVQNSSGDIYTVPWTLPPAMPLWLRLLPVLAMLPFFACAIFITLYVPTSTLKNLLLAYFLLLPVGLLAGMVSFNHTYGSTLVVRWAFLLFSAMGIHLHLVIANRINGRMKRLLVILYGVTSILMLLEIAEFSISYHLITVLSVTASFIILLRAPKTTAVRVTLTSVGFVWLSTFVAGMSASGVGLDLMTTSIIVLTFVSIPFFYTYATCNQWLGRWELHFRRIFSYVIFGLIGMQFILLTRLVSIPFINLRHTAVLIEPWFVFVVMIFSFPFLRQFLRKSDWLVFGQIGHMIDKEALVFARAVSLNLRETAVIELVDQMTQRLRIQSSCIRMDQSACCGEEWVLQVPLVQDDVRLGVWDIGAKETEAHYSMEEERKLTHTLSAMISQALWACRQHQALQEELAQKDSLHQKALLVNKMAALGRLSGQLAHNLMTPVHTLRSLLELMQRYPDDDSFREWQQRSFITIDHIADIINDVRNFARPSSDTMEPLDFSSILVRVLALSESIIRDGGVKVELQIGSTPPIFMSSSELSQLLTQLIINACESMQEAKTRDRHLYIKSRYEAGSSSILISIKDTGKGIPKEDVERIFEPFYTTKQTGTGIGLAYAYQVVQSHEGDIYVSATPGEGAEFIVRLPAHYSEGRNGFGSR